MRAAVLIRQGAPLEQRELPDPEPAPGQIALAVRACGVCRTDLHLRDGEIDAPAPAGGARTPDRRSER